MPDTYTTTSTINLADFANALEPHLNNFERTTSLMQNEILELKNQVENHLDYSRVASSEILELKNQLEICRRSIDVLLTDRERTIKQRVRRALFTLTSRVRRAWANRPRLRITRGGN